MIKTKTDLVVPLDHYEIQILSVLQEDGRLTNQQLAEQVGLSPSACWRRVKALEDEGVIMRYAAIIDPKKIGVGECVFVHVTLLRHSKTATQEFVELVYDLPEVMECFTTSGDADILLRVVTPSVSAYNDFLENVIFQAKGVSQVHSNFALKQVKFQTALPIPAE